MFTKAVILSAGQGKRLLPLTEERPKCLLPFHGRTLLEWQVAALAENNIRDVTVVTGFHAEAVEAELRARPDLGAQVRCLFNPFFEVADNAGSCYLARDIMHGAFVLLNGDTLFEPALLARAMAQASRPITVTIDRKERYDSDDMKVVDEGGRLLRIGKDLEHCTGESIGMLFFRDGGGEAFAQGLEHVLRQPGGLRRWYLSVIDQLASGVEVGVASIQGLGWCEVDFPRDMAAARDLTARMWSAPGKAQGCGGG